MKVRVGTGKAPDGWHVLVEIDELCWLQPRTWDTEAGALAAADQLSAWLNGKRKVA